jgi:hypothetical protein
MCPELNGLGEMPSDLPSDHKYAVSRRQYEYASR